MRISDWSSDVCSSDLRHHRTAVVGQVSVIVTGAGGDIGRAIVAELQGQGRAVAALDISPVALDRIETRESALLHRIVADVRALDAVRAAVAEARARLGPIDVLRSEERRVGEGGGRSGSTRGA